MRVFTLALLCCVFCVAQTQAQYFFQTKIVNNNFITTPYQGAHICISGDGNTMMIGAPRDSNKRGSVHIYNRQGNAWVFDTTIWAPLKNLFVNGNYVDNGFGSAIAMSKDGSRAAIGRWGDNDGSGGVWIFEKDVNGDWSDVTGWLHPSGTQWLWSRYGISLDMTDDGNTIVVGASAYGTGGAAYIIYKSGSTWSTYLLAAGSDNSGLDVAIAGNGSRVFIGEPTGNKIQEWEMTSWWTYKGYIPVISTSYPSLQGQSIDASYTGDTLVAGTINFGGPTTGVVAMKRSSTGVWSQIGTSIIAQNSVTFVNKVALSADAKRVVFSSPEENSQAGAAYYSELDATGNWTQPLRLYGNGAIGNAHQGYGLAISGDGNVIASGGYADNSNLGATWIFTQMQPQLAAGTITGSPFCKSTSYTATVPFTANMTGGMYDVQLSDANGSFTLPSVIGSGSSNPIIVSIPANTPAGINYRMRVVYTGGGDLNNSFEGAPNSAPLAINACTSVDDVASMKLKVYPNPASNGIRVEGLTRSLHYSMVNVAGAVMQTGELTPQNATVNFNAPGGVYFIQLRDGDSYLGSVRVVVQH
ncbi:T9SS type A sorting domain-containing protein [Polluticoccus soli]|uniref:T9SS type A sorting domain-containing protein n=1 Tax=Polluticoccus soli TaxID=3034150 RepID=UPI0023E10A01|nr:T9SS type A sorting domain-containing protein [Flavipsychrobacter sp. JY13-12]